MGQFNSRRSLLSVYLQPVCLRMLLLGFSAGLPLLLVLGTLSFWLREAGLDLSVIGFMSWIGLVYGCKWLWAPMVDNIRIPFFSARLGQRKAWLGLAQILIIAGLAGMAFSDPQTAFHRLIFFSILTAFASATQDIALDAYRIESAASEYQGALAATYQTGYRLAMIWAGAGVFLLAGFFNGNSDAQAYNPLAWRFAYCIMAASVAVGLLTTVFSPAPSTHLQEQKQQQMAELKVQTENFIRTHQTWPQTLARFVGWFKAVCLSPLADFFYRYRWHAVAILLLIATYRISDVVMGVMSNPFYHDLGFSKEEVATVSKVYGVIMTLAGAFLGGAVMLRLGVMKTLFLGAALSAATNLLFSWLALIGHDLHFLIFTVSADNLASGLASAAFIAYLSGLTNTAYSATQYALFSSIMLILPKFLAGFSGVIVEAIGFSNFFIGTALIGVPVMILIPIIAKLDQKRADQSPSSNTEGIG